MRQGLGSGGNAGISGSDIDTGIALGSGAWFIGDFNGDGQTDLGWSDQAAGNTLKYNLHNGAFTPPDLATSFTDGFGLNQSPTYVPLTNASYYSKNSGAVFPEVD